VHLHGTTRRGVLLGGAVVLAGGLVALAGRSGRMPRVTQAFASDDGASGGTTDGAPLEASAIAATGIAGSASASQRADRLKQMGTIMFPMDPSPRCSILDNFGDPRSGGRRHEGIDLLATQGQPVYAVADGVLSEQTNVSSPLAGNSWGLTAVGGTYYFYAHLSSFAPGLTKGSTVARGDVIGFVGDTGNPGPGNYHLHFEVHPGGPRSPAVDPLPLLQIPKACSVS
jgi:murein DD-endopeptidase MepM/ murein hydrolase activator NlpD